MKFTRKLLTALAVSAATAQAQTTVTPQVDIMSDYISRGMVFGKGISAQPSITVTNSTFTAQAWANRDSRLGMNELDLYVRAATTLRGVRIETSYGKFLFRNAGIKESQEASISATRRNLNATVVHDWRAGKGSYAEIAYTQPVSKHLPVSTRVAAGYNNHYFQPASAVSHVEAKVTAPINLRGITLTPQAQYVKALHPNFQSRSVYGLSIAKQF